MAAFIIIKLDLLYIWHISVDECLLSAPAWIWTSKFVNPPTFSLYSKCPRIFLVSFVKINWNSNIIYGNIVNYGECASIRITIKIHYYSANLLSTVMFFFKQVTLNYTKNSLKKLNLNQVKYKITINYNQLFCLLNDIADRKLTIFVRHTAPEIVQQCGHSF